MKNLLISSLGIVFLLSGCASLPDRIPELEQAREAVNAVDRDPMAERVSGAELKKAKQALQRAESVKESNGELNEILHQAYLANRHADIITARIGEATAREKIERSEAERKQVLLQARAREAEKANAEAELARQEAERAQALAEARGDEAERQRRRANEAIEQAEALEESLAELKAEQTERGLVLTLSDVLFDTNESDLKPGAESAISQLAEFMAENESRQLLIEGHTDSSGDDLYNKALSERRANAVRSALIDKGVDAGRLRAVGRGESVPVATNDTMAGRQENRRVEIVVSDMNGEFSDTTSRTQSNLN